jgi:hypothetical protein
MGPGWIQAAADLWWVLCAFVAHLVRTETTRAVMRRDVDALERQRVEDTRRIDSRLDEISRDIKKLLERE